MDISDDAFDARVHLLSAMFGKKDLVKEISLQKDRSGAVGAGFIPPTSGSLRTIILRTLFPLPQHHMSAQGMATLTMWLKAMPNEKRRLRFLLSLAPMYNWACKPSAVVELMVFLKETQHAALFLALIAAQVGPFRARSELINSLCSCGVQIHIIHAAAVILKNISTVDSSNLNGHYSLLLTHPMDSFLLRMILHRDCFVSYTLSQRHLSASRPRSRGAEHPAQVECPSSCPQSLALPPTNEDFDVPKLTTFAYGVLQHQIFSLISDEIKLENELRELNCTHQGTSAAIGGPIMVTASGLEKLVETRFQLLNNLPVVAFAIKCTSSIKVC